MSDFSCLARDVTRPGRILISDESDPFINLAIEEALFSDQDFDSDLIFLCRNSPCVVIGVFQNPWIECDVDWLETQHLPVLRRISGGGAVWHDEGNINISFMGRPYGFDQCSNLAYISGFLGSLGLNAETTSRGDTLVSGKKISGNGLKKTIDRTLHHCTLLVDANLSNLHRALFVSPQKIDDLKTAAVRSVRAAVCQLTDLLPAVNTERILNLLAAYLESQTLASVAHIDKHTALNGRSMVVLEELEAKYHSWEWNFGRTPPFRWGNTDIKSGRLPDGRIFSGLVQA